MIASGKLPQGPLIARAHAHDEVADTAVPETLPHVGSQRSVQRLFGRKERAEGALKNQSRQVTQRDAIPAELPQQRDFPGRPLIPLDKRVHYDQRGHALWISSSECQSRLAS